MKKHVRCTTTTTHNEAIAMDSTEDTPKAAAASDTCPPTRTHSLQHDTEKQTAHSDQDDEDEADEELIKELEEAIENIESAAQGRQKTAREAFELHRLYASLSAERRRAGYHLLQDTHTEER